MSQDANRMTSDFYALRRKLVDLVGFRMFLRNPTAPLEIIVHQSCQIAAQVQ